LPGIRLAALGAVLTEVTTEKVLSHNAASNGLIESQFLAIVGGGAIGAGLAPLGLSRRPRDLATKQAAASVGPLAHAHARGTTSSSAAGRARRGLPAPRGAELADALAAAGRGDRTALDNLVLRESAATASDGQFVNRCTDIQQPPTAVQAAELAQAWGQKYPVFGRQAAIGLMTCSAWPVSAAPPLPEELDLPVLVLTGVADPVVGTGGQSSVTGALGSAGARHASVSWQGWGHPALPHSGCAQQMVADYLAEARLPRDGSACPA
ncbi:alpha/beta hydrolase, partial [Nocardia farcinica]|uniref:alpha/beta hydrolase n=1 Tax=Nocardia farcinica TaxID=37329 RepID=UPI002453B26F